MGYGLAHVSTMLLNYMLQGSLLLVGIGETTGHMTNDYQCIAP